MLLLIAVANTPWYLWGREIRATTIHPPEGSALDRITQVAGIIGVDFRVYPMFAFLCGYGMVQLLRRQQTAGHSETAVLALLRRVAVIGIAIGWLGGLPHAAAVMGVLRIPEESMFVFEVSQMATGLPAGLGYAAVFGLIGHRLGGPRRSGPLPTAVAAVGRRSLSAYLAQSLLCASVLAAWGLGVGAHLHSASMAGYAIGVWLIAVITAYFLERRGSRGPAETLLRQLTYRRRYSPNGTPSHTTSQAAGAVPAARGPQAVSRPGVRRGMSGAGHRVSWAGSSRTRPGNRPEDSGEDINRISGKVLKSRRRPGSDRAWTPSLLTWFKAGRGASASA
ncbi:DUF418 domain-containing protein [Streptosporangium canum]|uniref:DUF418 domain-containing protein n=1 Tax=Streptosporangium canum TaxID=324952 RepID=UPI0036B2B955